MIYKKQVGNDKRTGADSEKRIEGARGYFL
jgi:hypothetical protein